MIDSAGKSVLVYSLSEVSQSDWCRAALTELERLSSAGSFSLQVQTDTNFESFRWSMAETANPVVVFLFTPVLPDPRNRSDHVAVFRGRQPGTHDLVSLTELKADCASSYTLGFAVDSASAEIFEAIFSSVGYPAIATGSLTQYRSHQDPYEATNLEDDLRRIENFVSAMGSVKIAAADSRRIWALITNRYAVTDFSRPHIPIVDPDHDASVPPGDGAVWFTRDRARWRTIEPYPAAPSRFTGSGGTDKDQLSICACECDAEIGRVAERDTEVWQASLHNAGCAKNRWPETEFSVVSWVRLGNRPRQVWVDTRSLDPAEDKRPWPTGPYARGWLMGALQWDSPRPALLFQLNAGCKDGPYGWRGQNFIARGDVAITDGQWHSLTAVVRLKSERKVDVELWVDGDRDGPMHQAWAPQHLFYTDYLADTALLLGESVDAYRPGARFAADFHGDLAAVGVYEKALEESDIVKIRSELDRRIASWK